MLFVVQDREKDTICKEDIPNICRLCLRSDYLMQNIFNVENNGSKSVGTDDTLTRKINRCFQLEINESDGLPSNICYRCINRIEVYTEYRDKCIENDKILRTASSYHDIEKYIKKEEEIEILENNLDGTNEEVARVSNKLLQNEQQNKSGGTFDQHLNAYSTYLDAVRGIPEFQPDENSIVMVVDPTKCYNSSNGSDGDESGHSDSETFPKHHLNSQQSHRTTNEILKNLFMCKHCDKAFTKFEDCEYHENHDHDTLNPNKCSLCSSLFAHRSVMIMHIREFHLSDKPYVCVECEKGFGRRSDLKKHTIVHTGVRPYICPVCHKNFSRNTNLTKHLRIHSGHKPFVCPNCPRSFMNKSDLYRHYNIHFDEKLFKCTQCDAKFSRKDKLKNHERKHSNVVANSGAKDNKNLSDAEMKMGLMSNGSAQVGSGGTRPLPMQTEEVDTENMVIALDPFQDMNPHAQHLLQEPVIRHHHHMHSEEDSQPHHPDPHHQQQQPQQHPEQSQSLPFQEVANRGVYTADEMPEENIKHLDYNFPGHVTGDVVTYPDSGSPEKLANLLDKRKYLCDQCPNRFSSKSSLINHKNIHLGIRNHICPVCHKAFLRKRELERHSVIHTGVKAFVCVTCNKGFGRKDKLIRHERIHADDRNRMFKCGECPAMYNRKDGLLAHMKLHMMMQNDGEELDAIPPYESSQIQFPHRPQVMEPPVYRYDSNAVAPQYPSLYMPPSSLPHVFSQQMLEPPIIRFDEEMSKSFEVQNKILDNPHIVQQPQSTAHFARQTSDGLEN